MIVEAIFDLVSYKIDEEPHIKVRLDVCTDCTHRACTYICPARCYEWNEQKGRLSFAHEACLECGSCLIVCDRGAIEWEYPAAGFGVRYRLT